MVDGPVERTSLQVPVSNISVYQTAEEENALKPMKLNLQTELEADYQTEETSHLPQIEVKSSTDLTNKKASVQ